MRVTEDGERRIVGAVVPHAGYIYSGPVASHVYGALARDGRPQNFVILGPSHWGHPGFCAMLEGVWRTPLGDVQVDSEVARLTVEHSQYVDVNPEAHEREHSIEVQLPFLQHLYGSGFRIVPLTVGYCDFAMCEDVGRAIAAAAREQGRDVVVLGSTDFTHYGANYGYAPAGTGPLDKVLKWVHQVDKSLIDLILAMDAEKLIETVEERRYTMCGAAPVATMIVAAGGLGARGAELLKYATSYDTQGSTDMIVGYGAMIVKRAP